jgi:hypothetical protein
MLIYFISKKDFDMKKFFNPLNDVNEAIPNGDGISTSSLMNGIVGECPKCKQPFGNALVNGDTVYYCEKCRVSQPITH